MSETQTAPDDTDAPERDESDPAVVAEDLKRQLAASEGRYNEAVRQARLNAERARDATAKLETVEQDRSALEVQTVSSALRAAESEAEKLQRDYAAAMEAGDWARVAKIQVDIGRVGARLETLEAGKTAMENSRTKALRPDPRPEPATADDPIETDLARRTPATAAWMRKHADANGKPRFHTDPTFQQKAVGAHSLALGNGLAPDTPEYFDFVERTIGVTTSPPARQDSDAVPLAAPTRSAPAYRDNQRRDAGAIPPDAVQYAKNVLGVDPVEYWKEVQRMDRNGEFKNGNPWRRRA